MAIAYFSLPNENAFQCISGEERSTDVLSHGFFYQSFDESKTYLIPGAADRVDRVPELDWETEELNTNVLSKTQYQSKLDLLIKELKSGCLEKVVFSRRKFVKTYKFSIREMLFQLRKRYPSAFIYALKSDLYGVWLGASPEILINGIRGQFETVALAGTKKAGEGEWGDKEKHEQQIVTDYILELLRTCNVENMSSTSPQTINAGPVDHLRTDISFTYKNELLELIRKLSPTPAVCGVPKMAALDWIRNNELSTRSLYSSFIAYFDGNQLDAFVNLRSMQVGSNGLKLYLGGGITKDSIPLEEWKETELKAKTLTDLI